jgi:hypothetical protein
MNKKRLGIGVGAAVLVALLISLLLRPSAAQRSVQSAPEATRVDSPAPHAVAVQRLPAPPPAPKAPIIAELSVEKREVCSGEDNLLTVRLSDEAAKDPDLRITLPGFDAAGPEMVFRLYERGGHAQPEMPEVVVKGPNGAVASMKIPEVKVKDCMPGPSLMIEASVLANTQANYVFAGKIVNPGSTPFKPVSWAWDFGDGADATTTGRTVEHDYGDRPQMASYSTFLVTVRAADAYGVELMGRYNLELRNNGYDILKMKNVVLIIPDFNPRFPEMQADGIVAQRVRLHHAYDKPVTLQRMWSQRYRNGGHRTEDVERTEVDPRRILGTNVIAPGRGIEITATLDTKADPHTKLLSYAIEGTTDDGVIARGEFSVMLPSAPLPPEEREVVQDPVLVAQIIEARRLLGRDEVTEEDISKLRREGALDEVIQTAMAGAAARVRAEDANSTAEMPPMETNRARPERPGTKAASGAREM